MGSSGRQDPVMQQQLPVKAEWSPVLVSLKRGQLGVAGHEH